MKIRPLVFLVPAVILLVTLLIGSSLMFRVALVLVFVGLAALVWVWLGTRGLRIKQSEIPPSIHAGTTFQHELIINNTSPLPKWLLKAEITSTIPGYSTFSLFNLPGRSKQSWKNSIYCRQRGRYTIGLVKISTADPFGLFSSHKQIGALQEILVYPRVIELPLFYTSLSSLVDFGRSVRTRRISQISPSASSVREMVSGDSQEHIHWRSTAHTGKLMVKVFDSEHSAEETKNAWIILDLNESNCFGAGEESTEEYAVTAAASLLKKYLDDGMFTGLDIVSGNTITYDPDTGNTHFSEMLETLALVKASGDTALDEYLRDFARFGSHSTVIVITANSVDSVLQSLRQMKNYGHTVVAVFIDAFSFGGKTDSSAAIHNLGSAGIQSYLVKKGDNLARALDSNVALWYTRYA